MNVYGAYSTVAAVCAFTSLLLGFGAVKSLSEITNEGMWAIAVMTFAPAAIAVGVSYFINQSHRVQPPRDREQRRPVEPFDPGAFAASDR